MVSHNVYYIRKFLYTSRVADFWCATINPLHTLRYLIERKQGIEIDITQLRQLAFRKEFDELTRQSYQPCTVNAVTEAVYCILDLLS
jgi:hypothetical protein